MKPRFRYISTLDRAEKDDFLLQWRGEVYYYYTVIYFSTMDGLRVAETTKKIQSQYKASVGVVGVYSFAIFVASMS